MDFDQLIFILEMIGTAAFAVSGVMVAKQCKMDIFGAIVLGDVTAVGGGILRDMMAGQMPLIMRKRVYGIAAAAGAVLYSLLARSVSETSAAGVSMAVTVFVRFLAIHYRWNLPGFGGDEKGTGRNG